MYISFTSLILVGALTSKPYSFNIRSWELKSYEGLDIMDSGCSLIRFDVCANRILRILPIETTNSQTQWISDRVRFSYDGLTRLRLGYPIFCFKKKFIRLNWHLVFKLMGYIFNRNLVNYCGCSFELKGIVGKFLDCKSSVIFKDFVNGFGGSLCFREQNFPVFNDFKNNFFFTSNFLELTELLIIIGLIFLFWGLGKKYNKLNNTTAINKTLEDNKEYTNKFDFNEPNEAQLISSSLGTNNEILLRYLYKGKNTLVILDVKTKQIKSVITIKKGQNNFKINQQD